MLEHALALAARGLRVFPCHSVVDGECTCREVCASPGKHPRVKDWQDAATIDTEQIETWWSRWPDANPAVATGLGSGCFVVDLDPRNDGFTAFAELVGDRELPETFSVATGGGGAHLLYRHPDADIEDPVRRSWRKWLAKGVDIKGDGGYVIGVGALHLSGKHYIVELDVPIVPAPPWLVDLATKPRATAASTDGTPWAPVDHGAVLPDLHEYARHIADQHEPGVEGEEGSRPTLVVAILLYKGLGLPDDADTRAIYDRYLQRCTPPWTNEIEIRHKIESAKESDKRLGFKLGEFRIWRWARRRKTEKQPRPVLKITTDEEEVADAAIAAIAARQRFFDRGGALVDVIDGELPAKRLVPLPPTRVREAIASAVLLEKFDKRPREWVPSHVPDWLARAVAHRGTWPGFRRVHALSTIPVLRSDGTLHETPGWDPLTMVFYAPTCEVAPVAAAPTLDDARAALALIYDVVDQFPFDEPVHKAAWLAALLTPFCRHAFDGPAPLMFIDANTRGSGKTKLVDGIGVIHSGKLMMSMPPTNNEEEMRKRVTTIAMSGAMTTSIDNVQGLFGDASVDMLLTRTTWSDRLLGGNDQVECEVRTTWYATGNNVGFRGDTARRVLHVRLCSPDERPEERGDFRYPNLLEHIRGVRGRLLHACATILRAYAVAGAPESGGATWGSYEGWCRVVRDCIMWLGEPDIVEAKHKMEEGADRDSSTVAQLIAGWEEVQSALGGSATAAQVLSKLSEMPGAMKYSTLRTAISELCGTVGNQLPSVKHLGSQLRRFRERVVNGKRLRRARMTREGAVIWQVVPTKADLPAVSE